MRKSSTETIGSIEMKRIMDSAAIAGNIAGAMMVAVGDIHIQILGYIFFIIGCGATIWLLRGSTASKSIMFVSMYFLVVNCIGIAVRIPGLIK